MADAGPPDNPPPPPAIPTLPFEFTIPGPPVSHQSHNKANLRAWRQRVREAAAMRWGDRPPVTAGLRIAVAYYHEGSATRIDEDNMLKPIQDALIGLVYDGDTRITDSAARKTPIDAPISPRRASRVLLEAFAVGDEFLHVIIDRAPSHEVPLR